MSAPSASNGAMTPSARAEPDTRLHGRWLLLARVVWVGVVALIVGFFITSLPVYLELLQAPCAPTTCSFWQLSPAAAQTLQRLGFSSADYATYTLTLLIVFGVVWLAVALVLFWRKSDDWMALLVALLLVTLGTAELTEVVEAMPSFWQVPAICLNESAYVLLFLVFSLFPNGRFVPRWMRWLVVGDLADALLHGSIFIPGSPFHQGRYPFLFSLVFFFFLVCLVVAQLYRYWRVSNAVQRQQTKWVVFALAAGILVGLGLIGPALLLPSLTVLLALIYFGLVIGLESLVRLLTGQALQSPVVIVASTLAIAALFRPLHRRLQILIDRRFYRRKYDAARTLAAFSATLRQEVDLDQLREHLLAVVQETMQPEHVSLWLRPPAPRGIQWVPRRANPPVPSEDEAREEQ